jgi:hypothetical protein
VDQQQLMRFDMQSPCTSRQRIKPPLTPAAVGYSMHAGEAENPTTLYEKVDYDGARMISRAGMLRSSELTGLSRLLQHLCIPYISA